MVVECEYCDYSGRFFIAGGFYCSDECYNNLQAVEIAAIPIHVCFYCDLPVPMNMGKAVYCCKSCFKKDKELEVFVGHSYLEYRIEK